MSEDKIEIIKKLTKDLKTASVKLSVQEARFLVDSYYQMQDNRIRADGQIRAIIDGDANEPHAVLDWLSENGATLENQIRRALDAYSAASPVGRWSRSIVGIGPVLSAGLLAHIDIKMAPTVGHIWRFAGLDPTVSWEKGKKRPWNASLKCLAWKIGESFIKVSGHDDDIYGKVYQQRKQFESERNTQGEYRAQAEARAGKVGAATEARKWYSRGLLPPGHLHARARRYAVKLFLAHWHHVAYVEHFKSEPPKPYGIAILGHAHYLPPPNMAA